MKVQCIYRPSHSNLAALEKIERNRETAPSLFAAPGHSRARRMGIAGRIVNGTDGKSVPPKRARSRVLSTALGPPKHGRAETARTFFGKECARCPQEKRGTLRPVCNHRVRLNVGGSASAAVYIVRHEKGAARSDCAFQEKSRGDGRFTPAARQRKTASPAELYHRRVNTDDVPRFREEARKKSAAKWKNLNVAILLHASGIPCPA